MAEPFKRVAKVLLTVVCVLIVLVLVLQLFGMAPPLRMGRLP
jgi:hypothetical protein